MEAPAVPNHLLVWCFDERNKNSFKTVLEGVGGEFDTALLSVRKESGNSRSPFLPLIIPDIGYSAEPLSIMNKNQLDTAIGACVEQAQEALGKYQRLFLFPLPFWYKVAAYNAITKAELWDKVFAVEASILGVARRFIQSGDDLLQWEPGLYVGPSISRPRGRRGAKAEEHSHYRRLPRQLQYLTTCPVVRQLTEEQEAPYVAPTFGQGNIDWGSFSDEEEWEDEEQESADGNVVVQAPLQAPETPGNAVTTAAVPPPIVPPPPVGRGGVPVQPPVTQGA